MGQIAATLRFIVGLLTPGGVLLFAAWALQQDEVVRTAAEPYALYVCYGAFVAAVLLSWYYDQSRLLAAAAAAFLTLLALMPSTEESDIVKLAAIVLLPLNLALFGFFRERGVLTVHGVVKGGIIGAQAIGVHWVSGLTGGGALLTWPEWLGVGTRLPWIAQLSFAVGGVSLLALVFRRRTRVEQGLIWALLAMLMAVKGQAGSQALFFYAAAAGLILVFAVLEHGYDIAYRDELTGLPSRRAFNHAMERLGSAYTIAMCDVDHFKKFNDTYGHDAGDQALKMVAEKLALVKGGGRAYRYGGEEFLIVFRGRSAREAEPYAQALRVAIAASPLVTRVQDEPSRQTGPLTITISIGIAEKSQRHSTPELVLDAADAAMYRAKEAGRNCVRVAEGTPELELSRVHLEDVRQRLR